MSFAMRPASVEAVVSLPATMKRPEFAIISSVFRSNFSFCRRMYHMKSLWSVSFAASRLRTFSRVCATWYWPASPMLGINFMRRLCARVPVPAIRRVAWVRAPSLTDWKSISTHSW